MLNFLVNATFSIVAMVIDTVIDPGSPEAM